MNKKILIIDDEEMLVASLVKFFKRKGWEVVGVHGLEELRECLKTEDGFNAVISDMRMPDGSGLDVIDIMKGKFPGIKICIASGFSEESEEEIRNKGADFIMGKPYDKKSLLALFED